MSYIAAGLGLTMGGPAGVLIPLGIERVVSDSTSVAMYYNWFALGLLTLLGVMSGYRDTKFMAILLPIWAAVSLFSGWLTFPDPGAGFAIIVVMCILAGVNYMQEVRHEKFGIAGPGNIIMKLFMFMIILQCTVAFVNGSAIFPSGTQPLAPTNSEYTNIDLSANIGNINGSGGLFAQIMDIVTMAAQIGYSTLIMLGKGLLSIGLFAVVLAQVYPWIPAAGVVGFGFLVILQFAIWALYYQFWFQLTYRPGIDPGW